MPEYQKGQVQLICKQDGIIAGLGVFKRVFELLDDTVEFEMNVKDGDEVKKDSLWLLSQVTYEHFFQEREQHSTTFRE